jgi:putative MATE family efflux protein
MPHAIAGLFGLDQKSTEAAASFIFWFSLFNVSAAVNLILSTALRATGDVITPLWFLFFSSALNVLFGFFLAFGVGPFPSLGVSGVALGGGSAGFLITLLFVAFWWQGRFNLRAVKRSMIDRPIARQLISIGAPSVIEQGIIQLSFLVFFGIVGRYGTQAYAAYGIGITLVSFSIVVGFGFGIATATLVGQQLGAGRADLAIKSGWRGLRMAAAAMTLLSILLAWFANELAAFMIDDPVVIEYTTVFIYMIAASQPIMACEFTLGSALRGAGDTRFPLIATFFGIAFGRLLPASLFLYLGLSVYWIFGVMMLDYLTKSTMLLLRYRSHKWLDTTISLAESDRVIDSDKKNT